jgi:hypothetical protein
MTPLLYDECWLALMNRYCNERQDIFCMVDGSWVRVAGKAIRVCVPRKDRILIRNKDGALGKLPLVKGAWYASIRLVALYSCHFNVL